jgi:hypothetical protein
VGVIRWNSSELVKCPVGALARHDTYGWVTVVAAAGWTRTIESYRYESCRASGAMERTPRRVRHSVDVRELRPLPRINP